MVVEGGKPLKAFSARGGECVSFSPPRLCAASAACCKASHRYHTAVLSDTGYLYTCGANGSGQLGLEHEKMSLFLAPVKALYGLKIRLVSCGSSFTVVATDNAQIFSWGDNRRSPQSRAFVPR